MWFESLRSIRDSIRVAYVRCTPIESKLVITCCHSRAYFSRHLQESTNRGNGGLISASRSNAFTAAKNSSVSSPNTARLASESTCSARSRSARFASLPRVVSSALHLRWVHVQRRPTRRQWKQRRRTRSGVSHARSLRAASRAAAGRAKWCARASRLCAALCSCCRADATHWCTHSTRRLSREKCATHGAPPV